MRADEFKALRHVAWDLDPLGYWDQSFCICTTPEVHAAHRMDPDGTVAKAAIR